MCYYFTATWELLTAVRHVTWARCPSLAVEGPGAELFSGGARPAPALSRKQRSWSVHLYLSTERILLTACFPNCCKEARPMTLGDCLLKTKQRLLFLTSKGFGYHKDKISFFFLLKHGWFTMLSWFLEYSKVT